MVQQDQSPGHISSIRHRPLSGHTAWLISDGKAGMEVQLRGVAEALDVNAVVKRIKPTGAFRVLAPWLPAPRGNSLVTPPWPDIAIATGRHAIPYLRALRKQAGHRTFTVYLLDPRIGAGVADLIWVPQHDRLRAPNVVSTLTSPHNYSAERLAKLRASMPDDISALPSPRVAVILGGKNGSYKYTAACDQRLQASLRSLAALGASFMITPSRRTHADLLRQVRDATEGAPRIIWEGNGDNPYPQFLAHADALVVTADSINMCGEACATGKPVYIFKPDGGSAKFERFHAALAAAGATRPLPERMENIETWHYLPIDAADTIASAIETRWQKRRTMLGSVSEK